MATTSLVHGSPVALTLNGVNSLAAATLSSASAEMNFTTNGPLHVLLEVTIDPGATAGNKQALLYLVDTLDATNYSDSINRENMAYLNSVYLPDTTPVRSRAFNVAAAFGGVLPPRCKLFIFNDSGAAFNSSGHSAQYIEVKAATV